MNKDRKKQLLDEYKNRHPEMGVISFKCVATGESFLAISKDTKADFNSITCKLSSNFYPNKRILGLWQQYGQDGFEMSVLKVLKYEDPTKDHTSELEKLREMCLAADEQACKLWK